MRRSALRGLSPALVTLLMACAGAQQKAGEAPMPPIEPESLEPHIVPLRSIDPADEDFADLMPLIQKIGDARVVVLGEATHSEGSAEAAKGRLVRFLHQEMGFDVLAWESGLVQCHGLNRALRDPEIPLDRAKAYLMSGGWATAEAPDTVFSYARQSWKTERPLLMAGFDTGRPHYASPYFRKIVQGITGKSPALALTAEEWDRIDALTKWCYGFLGQEPPPTPQLAAARDDLARLRSRLEDHRAELMRVMSNEEWRLADRFIGNALAESETKHLPPEQRNHARDRAMADNLLWLLEEQYPGRKVIVWAATAHFIRNSARITNAEHPDWYAQAWQAGNHLGPALKHDLYTIAVTSYAGQLGEIFPDGAQFESSTRQVEPAPAGSFEAVAHGLDAKLFYLDLRDLPPDHRLRSPFVSICLGRAVNTAPWCEVIDAFVFIDEARPVRHR